MENYFRGMTLFSEETEARTHRFNVSTGYTLTWGKIPSGNLDSDTKVKYTPLSGFSVSFSRINYDCERFLLWEPGIRFISRNWRCEMINENNDSGSYHFLEIFCRINFNNINSILNTNARFFPYLGLALSYQINSIYDNDATAIIHDFGPVYHIAFFIGGVTFEMMNKYIFNMEYNLGAQNLSYPYHVDPFIHTISLSIGRRF